MSHDATNWAIKQRGLKPAAKVVLWHLCDRYHPDHGCFPSLDTLADDCEMSRRSVQDQIDILVEKGLVSVEKMPRNKGKMPRNRYVFPFEQAQNSLGQNLPLAKSALGKEDHSPLANSRNHLGQNLPTNPVREPLSEAVSARLPEDEPTFREKLIEAAGYPRSGINPSTGIPSSIGGPADMVTVSKWQAELGVTEAEILEVVKAGSQRKGSPPGTLRFFTGHIADFAAAKRQGLPASTPTFSQQSEKDKHMSHLRKLAGRA